MRWTAMSLVLCSSLASAAQLPNYCGIAQWQSFIDEAASRSGLPSPWIGAVILAESAGCESMNGRPTTSAAGAMGLMQLMPATWERFKQKLNLGSDAYDPHDNVLAGAAYLRELYDRYGWSGTRAAYHAGPQRYDDFLKTGRLLPNATLDYLARIDRSLARLSAEVPSSSVAAATPGNTGRELFVVRKRAVPTTNPHSDPSTNAELFVALRHGQRGAEQKVTEPSDVQEE
jgi:soluble lytic murein transglycosylase-like protein